MSLSSRSLTFLFLLAALSSVVPAPAHAADVEAVTPTGYRVVLPIPDAQVTTGDVFGQGLAEITLPGGSFRDPGGTPQLPTLTVLLRVPWGVNPTVRATPGAERTLGSMRPVPLPYLITQRKSWPAVTASEVASYLEGPGYLRRAGESAQAPLLTFVKTAAFGERVLQVFLRPIRWESRSGRVSATDRITLEVFWDRPVNPEAPAREEARASTNTIGPRYAKAPSFRSGAAAYTGPFRVEPTLPWVRLGVVRPGLYVLSPADLVAAGVPTGAIDPASFRLFRSRPGDLPESVMVDLAPDSLRECAIEVTGEGDGVFNPGDRIYFYATGSTGFGYDLMLGGSPNYQEAMRSDEEPLWLTWGAGAFGSPPRRMPTRDAEPVAAAPAVTVARHRVHYEENRIQNFNVVETNTRWEFWFYRILSQGSRIAFPLTLPGAQPGDSGSLFLRMWGRGISKGSIPDHFTNLNWDGALVASASWSFSNSQDLTASGFTVHTSDTLEVQIPRVVDPFDVNRFDQSELAWFEVTYPRRLFAINDTLQFAADSTASGPVHYVVGGVGDTTAVWFLERSDPENPVRYVNGTFAGIAAPFTLTVEDTLAVGPPKRYSLVSTARAARPATIARYAPAASIHTIDNLLDPPAGVDYLIVTHPSLLASAESLAVYREGKLQGFVAPRVGIATTDRIAAQLGGGYLDAVAIRNLIAYARLHWPAPAPTYVCLFGDASLDPKNYLGFGTPDLVPTYDRYYDTNHDVQYVSDDFFGFLDGPGDLLLDVAIGRLPVKTAIEASTLVRGKMLAYENSTEFDAWRARALLVADDSKKREDDDNLGNIHVVEMERKDREHIPYPVERSKVYLNDYAFADTLRQSKPAARNDFIARINQGNWFTDYIGHGSDLVLADEQVFRASDVSRLTNVTRPSIFGFFSCTVGRFDALGQEGLAELLLKTPSGGASAAIAATEVVIPDESTKLNDSFMDRLFPGSPRIDSTLTVGLAFAQAKNGNINEIARKYVYLGDPGLVPPIPRGRGVWEKAPLDSVLRGDIAIFRGHALFPDSSADTVSTGVARIQVQGKKIDRTQTGPDNTGRPETIHYQVPGPTLFRGDVALTNGSFEARFVVPMDARVAGGTGQLRALLSAAGGRGVGLAVDSVRIGQGVSSRTDLVPPTITMIHTAGPDSSFQPGDRLTFVIEDSSGVDLTRLDNGHTIFVILDDRGSPVELTSGFVYDSGSYTRGTTDFVLPQLPEGLHTLEVHASDTFGNIAVKTFVLDVHAPSQPGDPMRLSQVFNYPNPFEGTTYIHARLNQEGRIRVGIYTVAGRRVRDLTADGRAGENYVPWDGKDSQGENVAIGVYLLRVTAESPEGKRASAVGRALRKR